MERNYIFYKIYDKETKDVVYIGKTTDYKKRISKHREKGYLNDDTEIEPIYDVVCDEDASRCYERAWINHFAPKWNKNKPRPKNEWRAKTPKNAL